VDWQETLLPLKSTLRQASEVLTCSSMRIVLIVDDNQRLLGTVTDGDIRRALVHGCSMDSSVEFVMEKDPVTVEMDRGRQSVVLLMQEKDLLQLPVVDGNFRVVGLEVMQNLIYGIKRENPVLLMAGGFGKRLLPLTKNIPKPLLKIGRKPLLESIIEQLSASGFSNIFIATHYKGKLISEHFGDGRAWGVNIHYLEETKPLGTAGALTLLQEHYLTSPLLVMNSDLLTRLDFGQLLEFHESHGGEATMCVREYDFQIPYGVVEGDGQHVSRLIEKPIETFFINAGIYVLNPEIIRNEANSNVKFDMPDFLDKVMSSGGIVNMFPIHEYWIDIGRLEEYERAQLEAAESYS